MTSPFVSILSPEANEAVTIVPDELILLDNYGLINPLLPLNKKIDVRIDQMVICFVMQGKLNAHINGYDITIEGGQVLTTLPESEGGFLDASNDCRFIIFIIYPEILRQTFDDLYINYDRSSYDKGFLVEKCTEEQMSIYQLLYTEIKKECMRYDYEYKLVVLRSYINALLINNVKLFEASNEMDTQSNLSSKQYNIFQKFLKALSTYSKTERSVQYYANLLNITPKYLSFITLQYSNKNASQWIDEYVVHCAKNLISIHHLKSSQIVKVMNFQNLISFNRYFKRVTGLSPKEFRKNTNT